MRAFVYGTLTDPDRVAAVLDDFAFAGPATLVGCHLVEGTYPTLAPGGSVRGRLLETPEADALDAYEGVDRGLYVRVAVPFRGGTVTSDRPAPSEGNEEVRTDAAVAVYVGDPGALSASGEREDERSESSERARWPGDGSFAERVGGYVRENPVYVRAEA